MSPNLSLHRLSGLTLLLAIAACTPGQQSPAGPDGKDNLTVKPGPEAIVHVAQPSVEPFDPAMVSRLKVPAGFRVQVFATGLGNPRMLAVADDGTLYVSRRATGDVVALKDADNDGKADAAPRVVATGLIGLNGITIRRNRVYLAAATKVMVADIQPDGGLATPQALISDLPDPAQHPSWSVGFGPDDKLYLSIGSPCNDCAPGNETYATMLQADADGKNRRIFAKGLRNTIGWDWHPTTREMWGMDHGSDWRGDEQPPEELNKVVDGRNYGWPFCFGAKQVDIFTSRAPEGKTREQYCAGTEGATLTYTAHAAPMALRFYRGTQFPAAYRTDAFVTFRGSWNREQPAGYNVTRLRFENNQPAGFEDFVTGFLSADGKTVFGRPVGLVELKDGTLLFTDDTNGVIYRVSHGG
jgi:glucose/arabinose dehydrogenase